MSDDRINEAGVRRGGYHSRGVPGEEADVRKRMRVTRLSDKENIQKARPVKGGRTAESTSQGRFEERASVAPRGRETPSIYVLTQRGEDQLDTPVFHAGDSGEDEAVAVFTERGKAEEYLRQASWDQQVPAALAPQDLSQWLRKVRDDGIGLLTVNPNRQEQVKGEPQAVIVLSEDVDFTSEGFFQGLMDLDQ